MSSYLIPNIWTIFSSSDITLYESAFKILATILSENFEVLNIKSNDLQSLFENGLLISNSKVKVACI